MQGSSLFPIVDIMFCCRDMFGQRSKSIPNKRFLPPARGGGVNARGSSDQIFKQRSWSARSQTNSIAQARGTSQNEQTIGQRAGLNCYNNLQRNAYNVERQQELAK